MVARTGPTNYELQTLLTQLELPARESRFWKRISEELNKPSRQRRAVNVYKIDKYAQAGETVIVPGKVLSVGELHKKVDVAAVNFSTGAKEKIIQAKGRAITISELLHENPQGKKVRILG
ncbi:MAG: 50S ribosomal protein L18e [Nanoarchaeota archaeon]|nr:50S ribosomal protein L18e [Nanoarchaeota archaeon]